MCVCVCVCVCVCNVCVCVCVGGGARDRETDRERGLKTSLLCTLHISKTNWHARHTTRIAENSKTSCSCRNAYLFCLHWLKLFIYFMFERDWHFIASYSYFFFLS